MLDISSHLCSSLPEPKRGNFLSRRDGHTAFGRFGFLNQTLVLNTKTYCAIRTLAAWLYWQHNRSLVLKHVPSRPLRKAPSLAAPQPCAPPAAAQPACGRGGRPRWRQRCQQQVARKRQAGRQRWEGGALGVWKCVAAGVARKLKQEGGSWPCIFLWRRQRHKSNVTTETDAWLNNFRQIFQAGRFVHGLKAPSASPLTK